MSATDTTDVFPLVLLHMQVRLSEYVIVIRGSSP